MTKLAELSALQVAAREIFNQTFSDIEILDFSRFIDPAYITMRIAERTSSNLLVGRYAEYRSTQGYQHLPQTKNVDTVFHLGIDFFLPANTAIYAWDYFRVIGIADRSQQHDYGGTLLLQTIECDPKYILLGHLSTKSVFKLNPGDFISTGTFLAEIGGPHENGNYPPHLHLQVGTHCPTFTDMPGVVAIDKKNREREESEWKKRHPDPLRLFRGI